MTWNLIQFKFTIFHCISFFQASAYQMSVLLMYNTEDSYTVKQIQEHTKMSEVL